MSNVQKLARICKVLSVETRVRIIQMLKDRALCVGAISARLNVTQGAVSQHLRVLRDADLVVPEKRGYYVHYQLNQKALTKWKGAMDGLLGAWSDQRLSSTPTNAKRKEERRCVAKTKNVRSQRS